MDVRPPAEILADTLGRSAIEDDDAIHVGEIGIDPDLVFKDGEDGGFEFALRDSFKELGGILIVLDEVGKKLGRIDHGFFRGLQGLRFEILEEVVGEAVESQADDQGDEEEGDPGETHGEEGLLG